MLVLGIDPGKSGGLVYISDQGMIAKMLVMPEHPQALLQVLEDCRPDFVFLEKAQAMPKQGVSSAFNYGSDFGVIMGLLVALKLPFSLIRPATWHKVICRDEQSDISAKERSLLTALRLFPEQTFIATTRSKKPHSGLFDAALIAEYGRRSVLGKNN